MGTAAPSCLGVMVRALVARAPQASASPNLNVGAGTTPIGQPLITGDPPRSAGHLAPAGLAAHLRPCTSGQLASALLLGE